MIQSTNHCSLNENPIRLSIAERFLSTNYYSYQSEHSSEDLDISLPSSCSLYSRSSRKDTF